VLPLGFTFLGHANDDFCYDCHSLVPALTSKIGQGNGRVVCCVANEVIKHPHTFVLCSLGHASPHFKRAFLYDSPSPVGVC
jgi:hypothetical protein